MANPISIRPWSRLGSLRSHEPKPEPEPEPSLKATNTSTLHENIIQSATNSIPTTPHVHNPNQSPNIEKVHSHNIEKPNGNGNEIGSLNKEESGEAHQKHVANKENEMKGKGIHTKLSGSEGSGIRVITISGENRGAYMQITHQSQKKPNHKGEKEITHQSQKKPNHKGEKVTTLSSPHPVKAMYVNSNVQCVNNSMVFNTSLSYHDPGLHLIIPKNPLGKGLNLKERVDSQRN